MVSFLNTLNSIVWGIPVLLLILTAGLYLSIRSRFAQIRFFPASLYLFLKSFKKRDEAHGISGFRALCTALAATVGTGNIAGVAGAIALGGPGVVFWMWISAFLGMITKFAEVTMAVNYRRKNTAGEYIGGPMYMILGGFPRKYHFLAYIYAFFGIVASFGVGNATQVNAVMDGLRSVGEIHNVSFAMKQSVIVGLILAALFAGILMKGVKCIGHCSEILVPFAAGIYILLSFGVLMSRINRIPSVMQSIITGAFQPKSVTCGILTSAFLSLRVGISRGVFTNEAGMGTASIAHASANTSEPLQQGLMGIIEVFLDTVVICTLTAFVILCSGVSVPYGTDPGITLSMDAFANVYGNWVRGLLTLLVCVFAFATILGWGLYGVRCAQFIFGDNVWKYYVYIQAVGIVFGSILNTAIVWSLSEILNGLMAIPNLIAIFMMTPEFSALIRQYTKRENAHSI